MSLDGWPLGEAALAEGEVSANSSRARIVLSHTNASSELGDDIRRCMYMSGKFNFELVHFFLKCNLCLVCQLVGSLVGRHNLVNRLYNLLSGTSLFYARR